MIIYQEPQLTTNLGCPQNCLSAIDVQCPPYHEEGVSMSQVTPQGYLPMPKGLVVALDLGVAIDYRLN